jgi:small subunit ribosomal protein S8
MTMTDPIADMLTRLRNANSAYHDDVSMPYSKLKQSVAEILQQEGYIGSFEVTDNEGVGQTLTIQLKFGLCRICLREMAHRGELPGVTKSSW